MAVMVTDPWGQLLTFVLGGGLAAMLTAGVSGLQKLRAGAQSKASKASKDMERERRKAVTRADNAETARDYWRDYAGRTRFMLREVGVEPPPVDKRYDVTGMHEDRPDDLGPDETN